MGDDVYLSLKDREPTNRTWREMAGRVRRWTLIRDIGKPLSASRSIGERSNLNRSSPRLLSIDKAIEKKVIE